MALTIQQQYEVAVSALTEGDVGLLSKLLTEPASITIEEQRTVAEKMGLKGGFLAAAVNTVADPMVWMATLMSRRFPTNAWVNGTIPQRLIGTSREFSGVALVTTPTEKMFRGTHIPNLNSLALHRQMEVMKSAQPVFDVMKRPNWKAEMPIVSQLMEGVVPAGATQEHIKVAASLRGSMEDMWGFLKRTKKISGGLQEGTFAQAEDFPVGNAPKHLRNYLPHIPLTGVESQIEIGGREALSRLGGRKNREMMQLLEASNNPVGQVWQERGGQLTSRYADFQRWVQNVGPDVYNPHLFRRQRQGVTLQSQNGQDMYITDLNQVLQKYVSSVAKSYSLNAPLSQQERAIASITDEFGIRRFPTEAPIMAQVINQGLDVSGVTLQNIRQGNTAKLQQRFVPGSGNIPMTKALGSLVRSMKGSQSEDDILFGGLFNTMFNKIDGMKRRLTKSQQTQLVDSVSAIQRNPDHRQKVNDITSWFYASTLGLNARSAFQNLLQPIITTMPAIGIGPTLAGMREFAPRVRAFTSGVANEMRALPRSEKGVFRVREAMQRSFAKNFPELHEQQLDINPRLFDIDEQSLKGKVNSEGKFIDKNGFFETLLAPFTASEMSNRAVTFFGAKHAIRGAIRTGEYRIPKKPDGTAMSKQGVDELLNFEAANAVAATQFRPAPGSRSYVQSILPSPLRQFTTFPTRLLNFFSESTVRGAMTQEQLKNASLFDKVLSLNGRNTGTLARTFLYGKIAQNGLRDVLGVDIASSVGLLLPFQGAPSNQAFAPLPIPPAPSALIGVLSATANRDIELLQPLELPGGAKIPIPRTLFPAGVALNRLFRAVNQYRPDMGGFVDDDERLLYRGGNKDAILQSLGIPLDKARRERQQIERLHSVRSVSRKLGRDMRLKASNFDFRGMQQVQQRHRELFPDMPAPQISQAQLDLFNASRRKTRTQRMLQTLPKSFGFLEEDIYDFDPDLIAPPPLGLPTGFTGG